MRKMISLAAIIGLTVLFSCKSKKPLVADSTQSGLNTDVQYDAYRNKIPGTQVERVDKSIRVTFDSEILFPINSSYLTKDAEKSIKTLVDIVKQQGNAKIVIEGHSDKTGTPEYNKWLSEKRAVSVKTMAVSLGLPEGTVSTIGYGDTKPVADNRTPEGRARNRRVEVIITPL